MTSRRRAPSAGRRPGHADHEQRREQAWRHRQGPGALAARAAAAPGRRRPARDRCARAPRPDGTEAITGEVTGFVLTGDGLPTMYVSGDNASLGVVQAVADHAGPIDVAVLFAGAARTPLLDAYLTLTSDQAARAARILDARVVIPAHTEGWKHFTQGPDTITPAFARHGVTGQLRLLAPGESTVL